MEKDITSTYNLYIFFIINWFWNLKYPFTLLHSFKLERNYIICHPLCKIERHQSVDGHFTHILMVDNMKCSGALEPLGWLAFLNFVKNKGKPDQIWLLYDWPWASDPQSYIISDTPVTCYVTVRKFHLGAGAWSEIKVQN